MSTPRTPCSSRPTREGFGLAVLEALACDVPVLATPVGIHPQALNGIEGTYCGPFDDAVWRAALAPHLADGDPRIHGRPSAERFSTDLMAAEVRRRLARGSSSTMIRARAVRASARSQATRPARRTARARRRGSGPRRDRARTRSGGRARRSGRAGSPARRAQPLRLAVDREERAGDQEERRDHAADDVAEAVVGLAIVEKNMPSAAKPTPVRMPTSGTSTIAGSGGRPKQNATSSGATPKMPARVPMNRTRR